MNKTMIVFAGLLFMSGMVFAGSGQNTYDRWTNIIQNTTEAKANLQAFDEGNENVDLSAQLAELQIKIDKMMDYQADLNVNEKRNSENNSMVIDAFQNVIHEAKRIITPILKQYDLDMSWDNLRARE
ncbi:MAG: hypothetical protein HY392_04915 [Candidatus Diapherotrites archaeon]|nr:hypothetical protein [Candidatus Diapherotrites archaeon]